MMLVISKQTNYKSVFNMFTTTTALFDTWKHMGLCTVQNEARSVKPTLFRKKKSWLQKRKLPHQLREAVVGKMTQQPHEVTRPQANQVQ